MRITETTIHDAGSVDFIIDNRFMLQLGTDGEFSIPRALNAAWDDEDAQNEAADSLDADNVAEETGATAIARAADLLRRLETYTEQNDDFASGDCASGHEFWGIGDVPATVRHNTYSYNSAQREAMRGLTEDQCAIACRLAGVEDFRE